MVNPKIGQLVAFRMLASRVSEPILRFVQLWQEYQQASLSVKRIGDIFNAKRENFVKNTVSMPNIEGKIVFDHVGFRYRRIDTPLVIDDMSFRINEGEVIGIVGKSGSGKSTVSKLLQRMYIPEKGKVLIDGYDISMVVHSVVTRTDWNCFTGKFCVYRLYCIQYINSLS